ncbi:type IV secretory system conjugative DNA transfer family protein [Mycoplasma sp. 1573]
MFLISLLLSLFTFYWFQSARFRNFLRQLVGGKTEQLENKKKMSWLFNEFENWRLKKQVKKWFKSNNAKSTWTNNFAFGYSKKFKGYFTDTSDNHALVIGTSGSGKTEKVVIPNIVYQASLSHDKRPNLIINDSKGDILRRTGSFLEKQGYKIKTLNLKNPFLSNRWTPLAKIWRIFWNSDNTLKENLDYDKALSEIQEIIVNLDWGSKADEFWGLKAKNLTNSILKFFLFLSTINPDFKFDFYNFTTFRNMLDSEVFTKSEWISIVEKNKNNNKYWNQLANDIKSDASLPDVTLGGILGNATAVLNNFLKMEIEELMAEDDIKINELLESDKPFAIYITYNDSKDNLLFFVPLFIKEIYQTATEKADKSPKGKLKRQLNFVLEEYFSIPPIDKLGNWLSISRSRNIFFMIVVQDFEQLGAKNKEQGQIIKSQCKTLIFLETNNVNTLQEIEKIAGKVEVVKESDNNQTYTKEKEFLSVNDLKFKSSDMVIVFSGTNKPLALKPEPAWKYLKIEDFVLRERQRSNSNNNEVWDIKTMKKLDFNNIQKEEKESISRKTKRRITSREREVLAKLTNNHKTRNIGFEASEDLDFDFEDYKAMLLEEKRNPEYNEEIDLANIHIEEKDISGIEEEKNDKER